MDHLERLRGDLSFVRDAVDSSTRSKSPSALYFVWAVIGGIGFALVDFRADLVPTFWTVAGPAGFLLSAYLGWRHGRNVGQASSADGKRHLLHWGAVLLAVALAVFLGVTNSFPSNALHAVILLVLALGYFTAGLHLDRAFLSVGVLMAAGAIVVTVVSAYAWTGLGIALAVSLVVAGIRQGRSRAAAA
jgi:hypothetical protein